MVEKQQQVVEKLIDDPAVENIASFVVSMAVMPPQYRSLANYLKTLDQRDSRIDEIIPRLQARVASIAGITLYLQPTRLNY